MTEKRAQTERASAPAPDMHVWGTGPMAQPDSGPKLSKSAVKRVAAQEKEPACYQAVTGITYPDGPDNIELAEAGALEYVTNWIHLEPGDDASDVPECDVSWLLKQGHIKEVKDRG